MKQVHGVSWWAIGVWVFLGMVFYGAPALAADAGGIVVWRLEAKEGVTEKHIDSLSGLLTSQVEHFGECRVLSEADISTILRGEETRQQCGGEATNCIAEIGNALGVPEAVSGDLGKVGEIWILNLRRIDVRNARFSNAPAAKWKVLCRFWCAPFPPLWPNSSTRSMSRRRRTFPRKLRRRKRTRRKMHRLCPRRSANC